MVGSTDIVEHKRAGPFSLYSQSYTIQIPKMSYLKVEPRRNVTIQLNHATAEVGKIRPAGSYKKMNRSTEDKKTFSFAPHLYFRRTQDIQWKTGYARI